VAGIVPPEFTGTGYPGLAVNVAGVAGGDEDYLPLPTINYAEWSEFDLTTNRRRPTLNAASQPLRNYEPGCLPMPSLLHGYELSHGCVGTECPAWHDHG
jgi:hypothetical protein